MQKFTTTIFILALFIACQPQQKDTVQTRKKQAEVRTTDTVIIADEGFKEFLEHFSKDSSFQMSRVDFPLKGKVLNLADEGEGPETLNDTIYVAEYWVKDLRYNEMETQKYDFTREVQVKGNTATVAVNGKEDGLSVAYTFRKTKGKWRLVWFEDYST